MLYITIKKKLIEIFNVEKSFWYIITVVVLRLFNELQFIKTIALFLNKLCK